MASYAVARYACGMPEPPEPLDYRPYCFLARKFFPVFSRRAGGWARASIDRFLVRLLGRVLAAIGPADSEARVRPGSPTPSTISPRWSWPATARATARGRGHTWTRRWPATARSAWTRGPPYAAALA
jgi:hypothetical protein